MLLFWQTIFITSLLIASIVASKVIMVFDFFVLPAAVIAYAFTFLATDIINEVYGKEEAKKTIQLGLVSLIFGSLLIIVAGYLPVAPFAIESQKAYEIILGQNWRIVFASLTAYYIAQLVDINVFAYLKKKLDFKHKWLRNNTSTITGQLVDTSIFITIAFSGIVPNIGIMILSQYLFKVGLAAIDTPFFYLFTRNCKKTI